MNKDTGEVILYKVYGGQSAIDVKLIDETVWLTQKQISDLFEKDVRTINEHIVNIYKEKELKKKSTIRNFRIVQVAGDFDNGVARLFRPPAGFLSGTDLQVDNYPAV